MNLVLFDRSRRDDRLPGPEPRQIGHGRAASVPWASLPAWATETVALEAGASLTRGFGAADVIYIMESGLLRIDVSLADGRRQIVRFPVAGEIIAAEAALACGWHAEAIERSRVWRLRREHLECAIAEDPVLLRHVLDERERQSREWHAMIVAIGQLSSTERLAFFLLWFARKTACRDDVVRLPMCRADIGDFLGLTVETVSRGFTVLRERGLIALATTARDIRLVRPLELERLASGLVTAGAAGSWAAASR